VTPFETRFVAWLRQKKPVLDQACCHAVREGLQGLDASTLNAANASLERIYAPGAGSSFARSGDCDYSLQGIGPLYTCHFHGKRIHDALSYLVRLKASIETGPRQVLDIGAGTGAVLWAWTLLACFARAEKTPLPVLSWASLDSSPEMVAQSNRLWDALCKALPAAASVVARQPPLCGDWKKPPVLPRGAACGRQLSVFQLRVEQSDSGGDRRCVPKTGQRPPRSNGLALGERE
jgi:hypothetical protein